ncbi:globin family protein [Modicisalibacter luteus]|uniref:hypothetical protein n=1 Tax=Modicisalibacter luteus TaxID=453962 RepID=UPI00363C3517
MRELNENQLQVIKATAPVVAEHAETIAQTFYPLMFERYPEVRSMFNMRHQETGAQPRAGPVGRRLCPESPRSRGAGRDDGTDRQQARGD